MANQEKHYRLKASAKLPPGTSVNIAAAGCGVWTKVMEASTGKTGNVIIEICRLDPGEEVSVDVIQHPERLQGAVDRGDLTISTAAK